MASIISAPISLSAGHCPATGGVLERIHGRDVGPAATHWFRGCIRVGDFIREQLFNIIAGVFLALFVIVWAAVLLQVGFWVPDGISAAPRLNNAVVCAAGVLSTSLSSLTASALGFTVSEVRREQQGSGSGDATKGKDKPAALNTGEITARLSGRIVAAVMVYLVIGLLVLAVWLAKGTASTDLINAFSLSILGWIIGAAGVVFQTERSGAPRDGTVKRQAAAAGLGEPE